MKVLNAALFFALLTSAGNEGSQIFDFSGATPAYPYNGWELQVKEGKPEVSIGDDNGRHAVCMASNGSSFSVQRKVDVDVREYPWVTWRWRVDRLPDGGDFRREGKDDQAAQLFIAFTGKKAISYIWDTSAPAGDTGEYHVPFVIDVRILVVASGPAKTGEWLTVTRNVLEDYRRLFGEDPHAAEGLRFQINTQHTGSTARSCLESMRFSKTPPDNSISQSEGF